MANDDKSGGGEVTDLNEWKEKKFPKKAESKKIIPPPKLRIVLKLNEFHAGQLRKVKKAEEDKTSEEVFLKALDLLAQYKELLANKGQLLVVYEGSDKPPVKFDFE